MWVNPNNTQVRNEMENIYLERKFMSKLDSLSDEELRERVENAPPTGLARCFIPDSLEDTTEE
jgi:hypothetical protein